MNEDGVKATESDLERIRDFIKRDTTDPAAATQWAIQAKEDLSLLVEDMTDRMNAGGGSFGALVREALEARIIKQLNGRAHLSVETKELSMTVAIVGARVLVDIRLELGTVTT